MRLARRLLSVAVAAAIFVAVGEVLSRAFDVVDRLNGFNRRLFVATDDPHLPYVMRPGFEATVRHGPLRVHVRTNELGLRGPSVPQRPAPGIHRILALGDSATFGEGLAAEEAFPALLEGELAARTGERYEVLNAGVEGYNSEAELAFLRSRGLALGPETVVVGFNLNDFDYAPVLGPLGVLTRDRGQRVSTRSLANRSELYLLLRWLVATRGRGLPQPHAPLPPPADVERGFSAFDLYISGLRKQYWAQPRDERWQTMIDSLGGLGEVARSHGLRLVVAIIPDGDQVGVAAPDLVPQQKLATICAEAHLDCLDLYPQFNAAGSERLYFDTMHPRAAGQHIIARALADHLLAAGG